MWMVSGIKIERVRAENFLQTSKEISEKQKFFTLWAVIRKRRAIFEWVIKVQMIAMHREPNAFLAEIDCGSVLNMFCSREVG